MAASEFRDVYARADKLLYEAKQAGRNRMFGEKLTLFSAGERRGGDRRKIRPAAVGLTGINPGTARRSRA